MNMTRRLLRVIGALTLIVSPIIWATEQFITIGTGSETGVYYPSGGAICKLVNQEYSTLGILCSMESTSGSIYNIDAIKSGQIEFGIVQSDWQYHGYQGSGPFTKSGAFNQLRAVFSLYTEPFNVIARSDSEINRVQDLAGKRVNIGNPGSGDRATMQVVMNAFHWNNASFKLASELKGGERSQALCDNKIDAYIYLVGHPNQAISEATTSCNAKIVPVMGPEIDQIIAENPYYARTTIPAGMYGDKQPAVGSFGVAATLVTSSEVSNETVYQVVKAIFEHFDEFKQQHPALAHLEKQHMISAGISIPLHAGAERYYREIGLISESTSPHSPEIQH